MIVDRDPEGFETAALARHVEFTGRRVVEIGSGNGRLTRRLAALGVERLVSFDVEHEAVLEALGEWETRPVERVHLHVAEAEHLPYPAGSFDLALFAWSF